jgi:ABC-type bacteriocin/lantibiotic exporter with double-glycine peptidase domain
MLRALRYYFQIVGTKRPAFIAGLAVLLLVNLYQLVPPILLGIITEALAGEHPDSSYLSSIAVLFGASYAFVSIIRLQTKRFLEGVRIRNDLAIRQESFRTLIHKPEHSGVSDSGAYIQTLNQGLAAVFDFGNILQNEGLQALIYSAGLTALLAYYAWPLAGIIVAYVALFAILARYFNTRLMNLEQEKLLIQSQTSATIVNTIEGNRTLKAYKLSQKIHSRAETKNELLYTLDQEIRKVIYRLWQTFQVANGIFFIIAVWQICRLASGHLISIALTVTLIGYVQSFVSTFANILTLWARLQGSIAGLQRLEAIYHPSKQYCHDSDIRKAVSTWQKLEFSQISFTYPGATRPALADKSAHFTRGVHTLIKGPSGSGKSTFAKIVAGVISPASGRITLDGAAISSDELSLMVSFAMQEVQVFKLSLKENITLCAEVPDEKLETVLRICRLESLVAKMPQGLETVIGNDEWLLSGGELLRLSLARALLLEPLLLILDETTSMIEESLETAILQDIREHFPQITLALISHQTHKREWITHEILVSTGSD